MSRVIGMHAYLPHFQLNFASICMTLRSRESEHKFEFYYYQQSKAYGLFSIIGSVPASIVSYEATLSQGRMRSCRSKLITIALPFCFRESTHFNSSHLKLVTQITG